MNTWGEDQMNDNIRPVSYHIHIEPDLHRFIFFGKIEISLKATTGVREIVLNAADLAVWKCQILTDRVWKDCSFLVDPANQQLKVIFPKEKAGKTYLRIEYIGEINDKLAGFYRSTTHKENEYAPVTQFQENYARRAFPCFDHPQKKAKFDIEMTIPENLTAISNCPAAEEKPLGNGKKQVRFQQTPEMSTYLVFFCTGEFDFLEDTGKTPVRVAALPGMIQYAPTGLKYSRQALDYYEEYSGVPYPLPKLDMIAIADLAFGAMENWGAIASRENMLLYYPGATSSESKEYIFKIIAHEIAHQWFGNLVTPSDWKYVWLNESFATYFAYKAVSHYYPDWEIWDRFLAEETEAAFERDSLIENFPIELPGGEHMAINVGTAPIVYNKGGNILRQLEGYLGKNTFQKGISHYLKKHAFGCASSHHSWEAFEQVSEKPVVSIIKSWIEQPGFPLITAKREDDCLVLSQKRFTFLPYETDQKWMTPVIFRAFYKNGDSETRTILMEDQQISVKLEKDIHVCKVNYGQTGFYRVQYEKDYLHKLGELAQNKQMSSEDRWGLQNDLFALARSGEIKTGDYLDFLSFYSDEKDYLPVSGIDSNLFRICLILKGDPREKAMYTGKTLTEKVLSQKGYLPRTGESLADAIMRDQILWHAVFYGSEDAKEFTRQQLKSLMQGDNIHPDIQRSVLQAGAWLGQDDVFEWMCQKIQDSDIEHERFNLLMALGCFQDQILIQKVGQYILEKVPERNKCVPLIHLASNPEAVPMMWPWYLENRTRLEKLHPMYYEGVLWLFIPVAGMGREQEVKTFFEEYIEQENTPADLIKMSLEQLEINANMRRNADL